MITPRCFACGAEINSIDELGAIGRDLNLSTGESRALLMCRSCATESLDDEAAFRKRLEFYCQEPEGNA